jgi:hypothetical protein
MTPEFGGKTYDEVKDKSRLRHQLDKVRSVMFGGGWHRLAEIAETVKASEASVSARLRDLRKVQFGAYTVDRRSVPGHRGLYEYRLSIPDAPALAHGKSHSENAGAP